MEDTDQPEDKKEMVESSGDTNGTLKNYDTQVDKKIEITEEVEDKGEIKDIDQEQDDIKYMDISDYPNNVEINKRNSYN